MLTGTAILEDGSREIFGTDDTWQVRCNEAYVDDAHFDARRGQSVYTAAQVVDDRWRAVTAPIPIRSEERRFPTGATVIVEPGEKTYSLEFDKIYAGFLTTDVSASGEVMVSVTCRETDVPTDTEEIVFDGDGSYRGFSLRSIGALDVTVYNRSTAPATVTVGMVSTCYPVERVSCTTTDDEALNRVLAVCRHTLQYCRQTIHLDSPKHCEPLACAGDYYIETLMTAMSFGDMRLAVLDLERMGLAMLQNDGRMFHTTYSLIWVRMLWDVYSFIGERSLLENCRPALDCLLKRFATYVGDTGLVETPLDYMFVDWLEVDGYSLHHPPKALGQTCMNMFYFDALRAAENIYRELDAVNEMVGCREAYESLRIAINLWLFDQKKGAYCEGLNTATPSKLVSNLMPPNTEKRYFRKNANILAACFGVCTREVGTALLHKVMADKLEGGYQPYFAHFLLEAIRRNGLREQYTLSVLETWKEHVNACDKGLAEGFLSPQESHFAFDHSHAWGGTPLYSLPMALTGLEILEPGMKRLRLCPSLLGLDWARVEIPTPYGDVVVELTDGQLPQIQHPSEVELVIVDGSKSLGTEE